MNLVTETEIDFGAVLIGTRVERKVVLRNDGPGSLKVESVTEREGFDSLFRYHFEPFDLGVSSNKKSSVFFEPSGSEGDRASESTLNVIDGSVETLKIGLKGRAVKGGCALSPGEILAPEAPGERVLGFARRTAWRAN